MRLYLAMSGLGQKRKSAFVVGMSAFQGKAAGTGPKTDIDSSRSAIGGKADLDLMGRYFRL